MEIPMQEAEVQTQIAPSGDGTPYINLVYTRMRDNGFTTNKTPNAQALAQRIVSDKNALDDIYDILTKDLRYKDLPDVKEFKQTLLAEAETVKKKAPSGSGLPTGLPDVQTTVTETQTPSIEVTEEQQTLQAPSTEASQIIDPLNPLAPVTKEQADIRALQTNQVGFIPEVNEQDIQKATSVLQKDFDQRNWGFGMASNEQDKARRAREKQRYVAENIDRLTRDYAIKRKRNEFIQDGLLDVSLDQGIERVKYVLRTDKGTETDKYEEQQAEATGKTKQFQDERNIRALSLYQSNLSNIAADLVKQVPNIEKQAQDAVVAHSGLGRSEDQILKEINSMPDDKVSSNVKIYLKANQLAKEVEAIKQRVPNIEKQAQDVYSANAVQGKSVVQNISYILSQTGNKISTDVATYLRAASLSEIAKGIKQREPNIEQQVQDAFVKNARGAKTFSEVVNYIQTLPDNVVTPQVKTMLKVVDRLEQSQAKYSKLLKSGLSESDKNDVVDHIISNFDRSTKAVQGRTAELAVDFTGRYIAKPIIDGLLSLPKLISNNTVGGGYGWTDELSDKTAEATSNFFAKGGDRLLNKQTLFGESNLPKGMQLSKPEVFADRLFGVLGFMATLAGTGGASAALGATSKVGQAATMIGTAFATTHDGYFREGIASGLTPTQSARFAFGAALAQSSLELVSPESRFFTGGAKGLSRVAAPISKAAIKEYAQALTSGSSMKQALVKGLKVMSKDVLQENAQEYLQANADAAVKTIVNNAIDEDKLETKFGYDAETAWLTTVATSIMGGMTIRSRVRSDLETSAYYNLVTKDYASNLVKLKEVMQEQKVPIDQQIKLIGRLNAVRKKYESLKELGKNDEETIQLALATVDRERIAKKMEGMPQPIQQQMQAQVDELDTQINDVVQGEKPVPQDYQPPVVEQPQAPTTEPQASKPTDPAVFGDLQDVKVDTEKQVIVAKAPKTGDEIVLGRETYVKNADGTKTKARFALIPIGAAQPSNLSTQGFAFNPNYPTDASGKSMNERAYQDVESQQKVERIANELDPEEIISNSVVAETGTPIVDAQMNVVGGNGRTMGLQLLASRTDQDSQQRLQDYQDALLGLNGYGFNDEAKARLASGKYMLVRVVTEPGYTWGKKESADMNRASTQATTSADVSARITAGLNSDKKVANSFNALVSGAANTNEAITKNGVAMINNLITAGLITPLEAPAYRNEQGVTPEGRTLLENVYLGQVLSAQDVKYLYDNMNESEGVRNAVLNTLPQVLETRNLGDWSLVGALKEAMEIYRTKQDVYNAATQPSLSGDKKSALSALLAVVFRKGKNQAREILKNYLEVASVSANSNVALGENPSPDKTLANLLRPYTKDNTKTDYQLVESIIRSKPAAETQAPTAKPEAKAAPAPAATPAPTPPVAPKATEKPTTEPVKVEGEKVEAKQKPVEAKATKTEAPAKPKVSPNVMSDEQYQSLIKDFHYGFGISGKMLIRLAESLGFTVTKQQSNILLNDGLTITANGRLQAAYGKVLNDLVGKIKDQTAKDAYVYSPEYAKEQAEKAEKAQAAADAELKARKTRKAKVVTKEKVKGAAKVEPIQQPQSVAEPVVEKVETVAPEPTVPVATKETVKAEVANEQPSQKTDVEQQLEAIVGPTEAKQEVSKKAVYDGKKYEDLTQEEHDEMLIDFHFRAGITPELYGEIMGMMQNGLTPEQQRALSKYDGRIGGSQKMPNELYRLFGNAHEQFKAVTHDEVAEAVKLRGGKIVVRKEKRDPNATTWHTVTEEYEDNDGKIFTRERIVGTTYTDKSGNVVTKFAEGYDKSMVGGRLTIDGILIMPNGERKKIGTFTNPTIETTKQDQAPKTKKSRKKNLPETLNPTVETPIDEVLEPNKTGEQFVEPVVTTPIQEPTKAQKTANKVKAMSSAKLKADNKVGEVSIEIFDTTDPTTAVKVTIPAEGWGDVVGNQDVNDALYGTGFVQEGNVYVGYVKPGHVDDLIDAMQTQAEVEPVDYEEATDVIADARHKLAQLKKRDQGLRNSDPNKPLGKKTQGLLGLLKLAFPNIQVVTDPTAFSTMQANMGTNSNAFVADGTIYINVNAVDDFTLVEEFGHVWIEIARVTNPTLFKKLLQEARNSPYYQQVLNSPFYQGRGLTQQELEIEAAAKAIADAGEQYLNKSSWRRTASTLYDAVKAWLGETFGFKHPLKGLNFGKVTIKEIANAAAKDLFRAADGELYKARFEWIPKYVQFGTYWSPISQLGTQDLKTLQGGNNVSVETDKNSLLNGERGNYTNQKRALFLRTYFNPTNVILGEKLQNIFVKNIAARNKSKRLVTEIMKRNLDAVNAETNARMALAANKNVSRQDIYNQVDKDFHDMLTNTGNVTLYSPEAQAWIPQGRAMLDNAQRELIALEKQYGKALTTTPELMDVLFQQYLAKRELTQSETLISEERDERIDKLREPGANLRQLLDLYSNSARASLNQLKRLQAKLMNGQVALLNQRTQSIEDVLQKQFNKVLEAYEIAIRKQSGPPATITAQTRADSRLANQELEQAKADLEAAKKAFEGRVPTSQEIMLADSIEQTIALIEAISAQTGPTTETQIMDAIMRDASQKRMVANLKAQLVAPIAAKYQNVFGTNKFNVQLVFGDGTTHDVGELDEITIKKLQGLGQAAWQDMIGTGSGMYTIPRPDLMMNNYMLERYNESIGQYITRSYQKFDRRTDWARQAKAKIGAQAFGQALNYINKQLARANPKSIVYNKAIEKYIVINSAGIEAQVDNIDAFIENMRKIGAAPADIIGITNLKNGLSTAYTFSYVTQNRMLANSSKLGLTFVPTVPQVDDVLADIISQDAIASSPTSQSGFNEGIFKMRKDVPEPIRILMGEVTSSNITLPSTYEYVLNAITRIKTEQALFETDVVSTERTPFHTYQVRFYSPPNTKGDVLVSDEKVGHRRDVWVTPEVAEMMFNELQLGQDVAFIRFLTRISSFFKRNFTIFSVGSQARNFISSMYFRKLIGGRWKMGTGYSTVAADASKIADNLIADVKGWENSVKIVGLLQQSFQTVGSKFSKLTDQQVTDLFNEVEELGVVSGSLSLNTVRGMHEFLSGDTKLLSGMSPNATQAQKDAFSQWVEEKIIGTKIKIARGVDALERVYQLGDDLNKIAAYLYEKEYEKSIQSETGLTDQEVKERAASTVRATLPNYDEAAKIFMLISRLPVLASFPMYAAETVRCVYNSAKIGLREIREGTKLGSKKMVAQGSMRVAGSTFFGVFGPSAVKMTTFALLELAHSLGFLLDFDMLDDEEEDAMRTLMPDFIKNNTFLAWKNNKTKEITYTDQSYTIPSAAFEMAMNAYERQDGGLVDAMAEFTKPFLSTDISFNLFLELFLNEDAYGNKIHKPYSQISGYTGDNEAIIATDRAIKGFVDYLSYTSERGGAPKIGKEFNNIYKAAAGQVRENGDPYNLSNELSSVFLGMKTNAMLPARRATSIVRNQYDQYQEMVSLVSNAIYNQRNTAEDIDKQRNVQERNMELVFKDIVSIIKAARTLGVTDKELFGKRIKDSYEAVGILSEAGIGSNLKTELRKAASNTDYVYDPEFSKELEKKLKEAKKSR